ncbi:MAG: helix-turn-helix transcriptional regulator [Mogibacterium sp.]|nr:helix-turn-helix transcriptional regulator [Mogibacterium sp.]
MNEDRALEDFRYALGCAMQDVREAADINQTEMAEKIGISKTLVSNYENAKYKVPAYVVYKYVKVVGLSFDEFYEILDLKIKERQIVYRKRT